MKSVLRHMFFSASILMIVKSAGLTNFMVSASDDAIANLETSEIKSKSITITWNKVSGVTYWVKTVEVENCEPIQNDNSGAVIASSLPFQITQHYSNNNLVSLNARGIYSILVYEVNSEDEWSLPGILLCINTGPPPPTNIRVSSSAPTQLTVQWEDNDSEEGHPVNGYVVTRTLTYGDDVISETTTDKYVTFYNVESNTDYTVSVTSTTTIPIKTSDTSDPITGVTLPEQVNVFSKYVISSTSSITILWEAVSGSSPSLTYHVTWNPPSNDGSSSASGITTTSKLIDNLTPSSVYYVEVTALNAGGSGQSSDKITSYTFPLSPNAIDPTTMIKVEWSAPSGGNYIDYYIVECLYSTNNSLALNGITPHVTGVNEYFYTFDGLTPGETYLGRAKARNGGGVGSPSVNGVYRTMPKQPIIPELSAGASPNSVVVNWVKPEGKVEYYVVKVHQDELVLKLLNAGPNDNSVVVSNLDAGHSYTASLVAVSGGIHSLESGLSTSYWL